MNEKDLKQLTVDYKTVFQSEAGQRVLDDLKKDAAFTQLRILKAIVMRVHF